jgi:transposase
VKAAVRGAPRDVGIDLADWNWEVVRQFIRDRFQVTLGRSSCLNYLHRLGFVLKRPKKRLLKANPERRATFVREYALLRAAAAEAGAKIFFVDEAHSSADVDLRGKWVLRGEPALVGSTSPRYGEKASYYSAVCLETGEVEAMELDGNSCAETSVAFLRQVRANHAEPLIIIWDNGSAHGGDAIRAYLATPDLHLRLVRLPAYSPDFNPDEAIWAWAREEVTANTCLGTKAAVQEQVGHFLDGLKSRTEEVTTRCRTKLQALAEVLAPDAAAAQEVIRADHVVPTCASV